MALIYSEEDLIEWFTRTDLSNFMIGINSTSTYFDSRAVDAFVTHRSDNYVK